MLQQKLQRHLRYLEQDPCNIHLLLTVSDCYWQSGDVTSAHHYLETAKQYTPDPFRLAYQEARLLHHLQRIDDAIALLEQSIAHGNADADVMGLLALLYFDNHEEAKAASAAEKTGLLDPNHPNARLVRLLLKALQNDASVEEIESLLESHPQESRLWFILGTTRLRLMNCTAAITAFRQAAQIHLQFYDNWIALGNCYLLQHHFEAAEAAYRQAIAIDPDRADGLEGLEVVRTVQLKRTI